MTDKLITPPILGAVTAAELRSWLRDVADNDATLDELISAASETFERETGRAVMEQGRRMMLDNWPVNQAAIGEWDGNRQSAFAQSAARAIELPVAPLIGVTAITLFNADNQAEVIDPSRYYVDTHSEPGRITMVVGGGIPVSGRAVNGIQIDYRAGYESVALVPMPIKLAIKQLAAHFYENRESVTEMTLENAPQSFCATVRRYRIWPGV
ncbi:MAG: head-tail connector protein [Ahrensia sp.]|nr:head-tail connector protein [Ahrensia sp.]